MRRVLAVILLLSLFPFLGVYAENVVRKEITITLPDVIRTGTYTGSLDENGNPDGYGVFETVNSEGIRWFYLGEWVNGKMTGEGWQTWEGGLTYIGTFNDSDYVTVTRYQIPDMWHWLDLSDSFDVDGEKVVRVKVYENRSLRFDGYYFLVSMRYYKGTRYNYDGTEDATGYFNGYRPIDGEDVIP